MQSEVARDMSATDSMQAISLDMAIDLANRSPAHLMLLDSERRVFDVNARSERLLGQTASALRGSEPNGIFAAMLTRVKSIGYERAERGFQLQHGGAWYEAQIFTTQSSSNIENGEILVLRATDITDRKSAEFQLLESEARLEEATRIASMGTYKLYWDTQKVIWSHQMYEIHGISPGSVDPSGEIYNKFVHAEDLPIVKSMVQDLSAGKEITGTEYRIVREGGPYRWVRVEGRVLFDVDGEPYASFGTVQDVTEAKNREEKLRDLVERNTVLTEALQASPVGVAVLTPNPAGPQIFYVNSALEEMTGFGDSRLIGMSLESMRGDDTDTVVFDGLVAAIQSSQPMSCELTLSREDGSSFLCQIELAPISAQDDGSVAAHTLIVRDVTDDRRRTEAMMDAQKMEALGKLSGGVAHEINNLLQPIITLSDLGREACREDDEKLLKYFEVITGSGRKAREVVRQILTFSRQDAPLIGSHQVTPIVEDAVKLAKSGLVPGLDLNCNIEIGDAHALVNPTQVSQVVINLVRNAADAMDGQGAINLGLVRLSEAEADGAHLKRPDRGWLALTVSDTGCGIDEESRARIFEPFFTTKPVGQGTGLGLSVVYSIVLGWGGSINIDSEVDMGTTAMVYIPEFIEK
ncbi:MAG: PAS domain S-box protein [Alphaproteobacteria bacterium]|nr:PAS domain S-box protein [Alphaproteobacteria bacterium]